MPCTAWNKALKADIFQCILEHRFCKSASGTWEQTPLPTPCNWQGTCTSNTRLVGGVVRFWDSTHTVLQDPPWCFPTCSQLLWAQAQALCRCASNLLRRTWHRTAEINHSCEEVVTGTALDFSLRKRNSPNSMLLTGVHTSLSNALAYVKHVTLTNHTACTWVLFYPLFARSTQGFTPQP